MNISNEKLEIYKLYLDKPYWEIFEAALLLCGCTEFKLFYHLTPLQSKSLAIQRFGLGPAFEEPYYDSSDECMMFYIPEVASILEKLWRAVEDGILRAEALKIYNLERTVPTSKGTAQLQVTYFLKPLELIYWIISQGLFLPLEIQYILKLFQKDDTAPLSLPKKKKIARLAFIQYLIRNQSYNQINISEATRKLLATRENIDNIFTHEDPSFAFYKNIARFLYSETHIKDEIRLLKDSLAELKNKISNYQWFLA